MFKSMFNQSKQFNISYDCRHDYSTYSLIVNSLGLTTINPLALEQGDSIS